MIRIDAFLKVVLLLAGTLMLLPAAPLTLWVATNGNDAWSGRLPAPRGDGKDGPFATLVRARDEIRNAKSKGPLAQGATVWLRGGIHRLAQPLQLTEQDSGTPAAPILYQAWSNERAALSGNLPVGGAEKTTAKAILERLPGEAQGKVWQIDLAKQGITNYGAIGVQVRQDKNPPLFLTLDGTLATLARWPNEGFEPVAGAPAGEKGGMFAYAGDRPMRWLEEKDARANGYWDHDWHSSHAAFESIDPAKRIIRTKAPHAVYGYRKGGRYYAYNLLSEIDRPGEYYLDRSSGLLYVWPPHDPARTRFEVSLGGVALIAEKLSDVRFRAIAFEGFRGDAAWLRGATRVSFIACTFRNLGRRALNIDQGAECRVAGCDFMDLGEGAVVLSGGDRLALRAGGHVVENCVFTRTSLWQRTYTPAVGLTGTGHRVSRNLMFDNPGVNIHFTGNDHLIEYNEVHDMGYEGGEMGAFYCGRNWTLSGNLLRGNWVHDIYNPCPQRNRAFMLDDGAAGITMVSNLFTRVAEGISLSAHLNTIANNVFVDCHPAVGAWGGEAQFPPFDLKFSHYATMWPPLAELPLAQAPWSTRFPDLLALRDAISNGGPTPPQVRTRILRNLVWKGSPEFVGWNVTKDKNAWVVADNITGVDPQFEDPAKDDWRLKAGSPALKAGFLPIPVEKIGVFADPERASWPVLHPVRTNVCRNLTYVAPPAPPRAAATILKVPRLPRTPVIDGILAEGEWTTGAMPLEEHVNGEVVHSPSRAWVGWDDAALYVAFSNPVNAITPMALDTVWGKSESVEIALRKTGEKTRGVTVLRGFAKGPFKAVGDAGLDEAGVKRAAEGVEYAAKPLGASLWTCEWRIPFASLGVNPKTERAFDFNLTVRKVADGLWVMWVGTEGFSYAVDKAGRILLVDAVTPPRLLDDGEGELKWTGAAEKSASNKRGGAYAVRFDASTSERGMNLKGFDPDLSAYDTLVFDCYSEKNTGATIELVFNSESKTGSGWAYYRYPLKINWAGWKTVEIPFAEAQTGRDPVGWKKILGIDFSTRGWGHDKATPGTILYIDNLMVR